MSNTQISGLLPIPGYDGVYFITEEGVVTNRFGRKLKTFKTQRGEAIELRSKGQRERVLICELLDRLEDFDADTRID